MKRAKKALIQKLINKKNAFYNYKEENPKWFTRKSIDHLIKKGTIDSQLELQTQAIIEKATQAAKEKQKEGA